MPTQAIGGVHPIVITTSRITSDDEPDRYGGVIQLRLALTEGAIIYDTVSTYRGFNINFDLSRGYLKVFYSGWDGYKEHSFPGTYRDVGTAISVAQRWIDDYKR